MEFLYFFKKNFPRSKSKQLEFQTTRWNWLLAARRKKVLNIIYFRFNIYAPFFTWLVACHERLFKPLFLRKYRRKYIQPNGRYMFALCVAINGVAPRSLELCR